ncbi:uncharacterized protein TOT_030000786 [Theileria orientalis strain Shintoku]|uniref:Uncharacterized protein n=1 Tax=Theileria orientalis strain Shintoku TaxID=869250 RepID=J4C8X0_THEOR|nr:uncharacterized protein TOT_030000786 [Theileria orientalis strain Shintoku]BAM41523.1 uncharacterized protein TOT_030000786 [Theileria orientalis strain Shintoku]|eukprot:XP_009691824.1 uncharacterized protein TOT_030000786 [Theileria orientalis strain Shintoku]
MDNFIYRKNLAESFNSDLPSDSSTLIVGSQHGTGEIDSLDNVGNRTGLFSKNSSENTSKVNPELQTVCFLRGNQDDSEEHEIEFTDGARCLEIRCHGELVWKSDNENQGKQLRLKRIKDRVEIEDKGTGEVKCLDLGSELYLDFFTFGSKHPNDKAKYDFKRISNTEGIFTFKKGARCTEVRGNGLVVWKAAKGDRCARSVSYCGTRQLSINFSDGVHVFNRKYGRWVKEGEEVEEDVEPQPTEEESEPVISDESDLDELDELDLIPEDQDTVSDDSDQELDEQAESISQPPESVLVIEDSRRPSLTESDSQTLTPPPPSPEPSEHDLVSEVTPVQSYSEAPTRPDDHLRTELEDKTKEELLELVIQLTKEKQELTNENQRISNENQKRKSANKKLLKANRKLTNENLELSHEKHTLTKSNDELSAHVQRLISPSAKNIYPVVLKTTDLTNSKFFDYSKQGNKHIYTAKEGFLANMVKHYKTLLWHTLKRDEFANKVELVDDKKAIIYHVNETTTEKDLTLYMLELLMDIKHSTDEVIYKKNEKKKIEKFICKPLFIIDKAWNNNQAVWTAQPDPTQPNSGPLYSRKIVVNNSEDPPSVRVFFYGGSDEGDDDDEADPDYVIVPNPDVPTGRTFQSEKAPSAFRQTQAFFPIPSHINADASVSTPTPDPADDSSECPAEIKFYANDPNDANKTLELDSNSYQWKKIGRGRHDCDFNEGVKCTFVVCDGIEVWKFGDFQSNQYPKQVSYTNGALININFPGLNISYEKGTVPKWFGTLDDDGSPKRFNSDESHFSSNIYIFTSSSTHFREVDLIVLNDVFIDNSNVKHINS